MFYAVTVGDWWISSRQVGGVTRIVSDDSNTGVELRTRVQSRRRASSLPGDVIRAGEAAVRKSPA
jgi:hypothetical protein